MKLFCLLLVYERVEHKLPPEAGAEATEKVASRNLNFFLSQAPSSKQGSVQQDAGAVRFSTDSPVFDKFSLGELRLSQGWDLDLWPIKTSC